MIRWDYCFTQDQTASAYRAWKRITSPLQLPGFEVRVSQRDRPVFHSPKAQVWSEEACTNILHCWKQVFRTKSFWEESITATSFLLSLHRLLIASGAGGWCQPPRVLAVSVNYRSPVSAVAGPWAHDWSWASALKLEHRAVHMRAGDVLPLSDLTDTQPSLA